MRGDLARDQFYFFTRYQATGPRTTASDNFLRSLQTLLKWHEDDPVDDAERARNEAIAHSRATATPTSTTRVRRSGRLLRAPRQAPAAPVG